MDDSTPKKPKRQTPSPIAVDQWVGSFVFSFAAEERARPLRPRKPIPPKADGSERVKTRLRVCLVCGVYGPHDSRSGLPHSGDCCRACYEWLKDCGEHHEREGGKR